VWRWPCWARRWRFPFGHCAAAVTISRLFVAVMAGAAALLVAACAITKTSDAPPATRTMPAHPAASPNDTTPATSADRGFSLVVETASGDISANVAPISVASYQPVDTPHRTAKEWNTAGWVKQSAYPSARSNGTSYIYGHACHHHACSFTRLKDVNLGDQITVTTASGTLTYRIARIGLSPKAARSLPSWAFDSTVPNRLVLVTCAFEQGDTSRDNIVVVAQLQAA
jgi:LPXTG-site transpeptidase (sortase) family protein